MKYIITPEQSFPAILKPGMILLAPGQCVKVLNAVVSWRKNPFHFYSAYLFAQKCDPVLYTPFVKTLAPSDMPWPQYIQRCQNQRDQQTALLDAIHQPTQDTYGEWRNLYKNVSNVSANLWKANLCFTSYILPELLPTYEQYPEHFRPVAAKIENLWKRQEYYKQYIAPSMPTTTRSGGSL